VIRVDVARVLRQLGVDRLDVRAAFRCRHVPAIDLKKVVDLAPSGSFKRNRAIGAELIPGALILAKAQIGPAKAR
jgi:hypothetical protein